LSGSATWSFVAASQYILGLQPVVEGLRIDPCIPSEWEGFEVTRIFRGKKLNIKVSNPNRVEKGVKSLVLNGEYYNGNIIRFEHMKSVNNIELIM